MHRAGKAAHARWAGTAGKAWAMWPARVARTRATREARSTWRTGVMRGHASMHAVMVSTRAARAGASGEARVVAWAPRPAWRCRGTIIETEGVWVSHVVVHLGSNYDHMIETIILKDCDRNGHI